MKIVFSKNNKTASQMISIYSVQTQTKKNVPTVINNILSMYIMVMKSSLFILYFLCILFALLIANYVLTFFVKEGMENAENNKDNGTVKKHTKKVKTHKF